VSGAPRLRTDRRPRLLMVETFTGGIEGALLTTITGIRSRLATTRSIRPVHIRSASEFLPMINVIADTDPTSGASGLGFVSDQQS
jgi:hypothetical protein